MINNTSYNINQAYLGLNTDSVELQLKPGMLTYALNAQVASFDGEQVTYQNEQANNHNLDLPEGYKVIGVKNIMSLNKTVFFLTNPFTGNSQIGSSTNNSGVYDVIIDDEFNDQKFRFDINYPIHKIILKITNCSTQLYWTDGLNPRRYLNLDDLPWKEQFNPNNAFKPIKLVGQLDANKLLVQPLVDIPEIHAVATNIGGRLKMGTYQFTIQYSNSLGDGYTSYYNVSNPFGIFDSKTGAAPDLETSKSIDILINGLDTSGLYDYFNLVVVKTINDITSVELIGTFPITDKEFKYNYTGTTQDSERLDIKDIFEKFPFYDIAQNVYEVDNIVGWGSLTKKQKINYQPIWNKVKLLWETWKIPYTKFEGYNNGANTANIRGYMRDEVYAFEGCFILNTGEQTDSFHIPGRAITEGDSELIDNFDSESVLIDPCEEPEPKPRWKVYNTGSLTGFSPDYIDDDQCYIGPYQYGEFAYWESQETYPNNPDIWKDLAGQPIRHHKFPDSAITHIYDSLPCDTTDGRTYDHNIYPIGIKIDVDSLYNAIKNSDLSADEKSRIVGFKITRGNRANNKSVIAKGMFHNVGKYTYQDEDYYYPNYPFNDVRKDPYFTTQKLASHSGYLETLALEGFSDVGSKSRFTFHSPDTHFYTPSGIDSGIMKLETIEAGKAYGHFVKVKKNAEYKFLSRDAIYAAIGIGVTGGFNMGAGTFGSPTFSLGPVIPTYQATKDLFEKIIPYTNFGYTFNSTGFYNKSHIIPSDENSPYKQRSILFGKYITDGKEGVENGNNINNFRRESSVYLNIHRNFPFTHEYEIADNCENPVPEDTSRYNLASMAVSNYTIDRFVLIYNLGNSAIVTDAIIQSIIDIYNNPANDIYTAEFTINSMLTADLPEPGDIYAIGSDNYTITNVSFTPLTATTCSAVFETTISNYVPPAPAPTPPATGTLSLYYASSGGASTSGTSINYDDVDVVAPTAQTYNLAGIRADLQYLVLQPLTPAIIYQLRDGTYNIPSWTVEKNRVLYDIIWTTYLQQVYLNSPQRNPEKINTADISSFYGSVKKYLPGQWGRMYSYETIDTGFYHRLYDNEYQPFTKFDTIFGGDIYINRFAYKSKVSLFSDTSFGEPNQSDIEYDKLGNYGYPMFWLSTRPEKLDIDLKEEIDKVVKVLNNSPGIGGSGSTLAKIWTTIKGIFSGGFANTIVAMRLAYKIFTEIYRTVALANINFDNYHQDGIMEDGLMYMYVYGIPYFFVESEVNVDFRRATNDQEGNFYPNVSKDIPDDWLQEYNVPIVQDNHYDYNQSYSKQNKENYFSHLREDFDPAKTCFENFPNRTIYSDKSSLEETKNNWLVYRPAAYFDFPKTFGTLTAIDKIENNQVLVRFTNKSQLYNALTTVEVSQGPKAYLGNDRLFSAPPIDFYDTDSGSAGSQHQMLVKTDNGHLFIDSDRGQVCLIRPGGSIEDLANKYMSKWFSEHLPFKIKKVSPDVKIDNHFNSVGLHGVYDPYYSRVIITKIDYEPIGNNVLYDEKGFYINVRKGSTSIEGMSIIPPDEGDSLSIHKVYISLDDERYFKNLSWTLSYNFDTQSWISFHSYVPNFYIPSTTHYYSGINRDISSVWEHDVNFKKFNNFYNKQYPYTLEYPFIYKYQDEIIQSVKDYSSVRFYDNIDLFHEPDTTIYFNKSIIYNDEQCSGVLNLIPKPNNSLSFYRKYPKYNSDSKDILVTRSDNFYNYNTFWNIVKSTTNPIFNQTTDYTVSDKELNISNLDYTKLSHAKGKIRGKNLRIRHVLDNRNDIRIVSKFITNISLKSNK